MKLGMHLFLGAVFLLSCSKKTEMPHALNLKSDSVSIINGRITESTDSFAKHVIGIYKKGETWCTGVVISEEFALTAAHCIDDVKGAKLVFGATKNQWEFREIVKYKQHEEYNEEIVGITDVPANDLLLIQFKGGLPFGYSPASMPKENHILDKATVTLIGFGTDENESYDVLKTTEVQVVESLPYEFRTEEKKSGSCSGDSGGPVFFKNVEGQYILAGLVSRGDENCHIYGIYENVFFYNEWIQKTIESFKSANH